MMRTAAISAILAVTFASGARATAPKENPEDSMILPAASKLRDAGMSAM